MTINLSSVKNNYLADLIAGIGVIDDAVLEKAYTLIHSTITNGKTIFVCGNGGSAAIAEHLSCDHSKGVNTNTHLFPKIVCLNSNIALLTATANDMGYDKVFSYPLSLQGTANDLLICISSSGNSDNIVNALDMAKKLGMNTIAFTGFDGGVAKSVCNVSIHIPVNNYGIVEDAHQILMHVLAQYIRRIHTKVDIKNVKL